MNIKIKGFRSRKSFCRSCSQTLFFGGKEAATGNKSAVRRLAVVMFVKKNNQAGRKLCEHFLGFPVYFEIYRSAFKAAL